MSYNLDLDLVFDILKVQKDGIALRLKKVFEPEYDILNNTVNPSVSYVNFFLSNEGKIYTALHNEFFNISRYDHECFYEVLNTTTNNILEYSKDQNYIKLTSNTNRMKPVSISFYPKQLKNIFLELIDNLNNL
jgi:hypothetical protein